MGTTLALNLLFGLLDRAQAIGQLISTAQREGRDVTQAELDALIIADDATRTAQVDAVRRAGG